MLFKGVTEDACSERMSRILKKKKQKQNEKVSE